MRAVIGIDPGITGGIAVLDRVGDIKFAIKMPSIKLGLKKASEKGSHKRILDLAEIKAVLLKSHVAFGVIEKSTSRPHQGVVSTFTFGRIFGELRGLCFGLDIELQEVTPQQWKKDLLSEYPFKDKDQSIDKVARLYPDFVYPGRPDHNIAEAILLARYGWEKINESRGIP